MHIKNNKPIEIEIRFKYIYKKFEACTKVPPYYSHPIM